MSIVYAVMPGPSTVRCFRATQMWSLQTTVCNRSTQNEARELYHEYYLAILQE